MPSKALEGAQKDRRHLGRCRGGRCFGAGVRERCGVRVLNEFGGRADRVRSECEVKERERAEREREREEREREKRGSERGKRERERAERVCV